MKFRDTWNEVEKSNLEGDRDLLMEAQGKDKTWLEEQAQRYQEDEDKIIEEKMTG